MNLSIRYDQNQWMGEITGNFFRKPNIERKIGVKSGKSMQWKIKSLKLICSPRGKLKQLDSNVVTVANRVENKIYERWKARTREEKYYLYAKNGNSPQTHVVLAKRKLQKSPAFSVQHRHKTKRKKCHQNVEWNQCLVANKCLAAIKRTLHVREYNISSSYFVSWWKVFFPVVGCLSFRPYSSGLIILHSCWICQQQQNVEQTVKSGMASIQS